MKQAKKLISQAYHEIQKEDEAQIKAALVRYLGREDFTPEEVGPRGTMHFGPDGLWWVLVFDGIVLIRMDTGPVQIEQTPTNFKVRFPPREYRFRPENEEPPAHIH